GGDRVGRGRAGRFGGCLVRGRLPLIRGPLPAGCVLACSVLARRVLGRRVLRRLLLGGGVTGGGVVARGARGALAGGLGRSLRRLVGGRCLRGGGRRIRCRDVEGLGIRLLGACTARRLRLLVRGGVRRRSGRCRSIRRGSR